MLFSPRDSRIPRLLLPADDWQEGQVGYCVVTICKPPHTCIESLRPVHCSSYLRDGRFLLVPTPPPTVSVVLCFILTHLSGAPPDHPLCIQDENELILARITDWPANSNFARGRLEKHLGHAGHIAGETEVSERVSLIAKHRSPRCVLNNGLIPSPPPTPQFPLRRQCPYPPPARTSYICRSHLIGPRVVELMQRVSCWRTTLTHRSSLRRYVFCKWIRRWGATRINVHCAFSIRCYNATSTYQNSRPGPGRPPGG